MWEGTESPLAELLLAFGWGGGGLGFFGAAREFLFAHAMGAGFVAIYERHGFSSGMSVAHWAQTRGQLRNGLCISLITVARGRVDFLEKAG